MEQSWDAGARRQSSETELGGGDRNMGFGGRTRSALLTRCKEGLQCHGYAPRPASEWFQSVPNSRSSACVAITTRISYIGSCRISPRELLHTSECLDKIKTRICPINVEPDCFSLEMPPRNKDGYYPRSNTSTFGIEAKKAALERLGDTSSTRQLLFLYLAAFTTGPGPSIGVERKGSGPS